MINLITEHIDIWTAAQTQKRNGGRGRGKNSNGQSPHGIKKLRELIYELAVRGKLVPQDLNDEPASVQLDKIAKEKARLIKEGKIKKQEKFPEISEDEKPFDLPQGWKFVRLGEIANRIGSGSTPRGGKSAYVESGIPFLRSQNVWNHGLELSDVAFIPEEIHQKMANTVVLPNDILLNITGASLGRCAIFPDDLGEANVSQHVTIIRPTDSSTKFYLHRCILSPYIQKLVWGRQVGMAREGLSKKVLELFEIPCPPIAEQHRIVAKVHELMALCDQLEQQQTDSIGTHQTLVETLLDALTNVANQDEFAKTWQQIAENFDILFTTEKSIDQLKQTILQLAVMGKLVPQDPNDEPASVLLEKIAKGKRRLIKEGKIKKQKKLPEISEDEKPFFLPGGWSFVRLLDLSKLITKGSSPKWQGVAYTENPENVLFVTSENVGSYVLKLDSRKYVEKKFNEVEPRSILGKGDFLMNIVGASIGRTAIYNVDYLANINQAVCLIRVFLQFLDSQYLLHFFNSETCVSYMFDKQVDNARANLSMGNIAKFVIPFPPLAEQQRIVAKVDKLMGLCDTLIARLNDSQNTQVELADAIVEQAVA